jgi:hypothetical protein
MWVPWSAGRRQVTASSHRLGEPQLGGAPARLEELADNGQPKPRAVPIRGGTAPQDVSDGERDHLVSPDNVVPDTLPMRPAGDRPVVPAIGVQPPYLDPLQG